MIRKQFTFYDSFYRACSLIRRKTDRCDAYEALVRFALFGEEPKHLSNEAAIAFAIARPVLDSGRAKAENGQKGGLANGLRFVTD